MTGKSESIALKTRAEDLRLTGHRCPAANANALYFTDDLCVQRQTAAVRMFLCFLRLGVLALEVSERHVQRLVPEADSDGVAGELLFRP
jgi:hypothetical protein